MSDAEGREGHAERLDQRTANALPRVVDGSEPTAIQIVWQNPWVRAVTYVAVTALLLTLMWQLRGGYAFALQVGVVGYLIAYILHPIVMWLGRLRFPRGLAVIVTYTLLLLVLAFGSLVISQVVGEFGRFVQLVPRALDDMSSWFTAVQEWLVGLSEHLPEFITSRFEGGDGEEGAGEIAVQIREQFQSFLQQLVTGLQGVLQRLVAGGPGMLLSGATAVISTTFQIFLILLAGAYFLYDFPRFSLAFMRLVPLRYRTVTKDLINKADLAVGGYLRGQLLITMMLGVMIWIGLTIIGVPLATAISFLAAVFNLVPYLGPILGVVPAVLLAFTVSPVAAILAVLVFILANQLEAHLLSPLILSRSTNLHPITVMLSIMAGVGLMGLLGALVAVPVVAMVKVVLEDYLLTRPAYTGVARPAAGALPPEADAASALGEAESESPPGRH